MCIVHNTSGDRFRANICTLVSLVYFSVQILSFLLKLHNEQWTNLLVNVARVNSYGCTVGNKTEFLESATLTEEAFQERPIINWDAILWVNRPTELWGIQLILALASLAEALLLTFLGYKVRHIGHIRLFDTLIPLFSTGKHLAANSFIPFHIGVGNNGAIRIHGKWMWTTAKSFRNASMRIS